MRKNNDFHIAVAFALILVMVFLIILAPALENAELGWLTNDYARITDMDYKAVVVDEPGSEGKIVVTERITFDVHAASRSNGFWELWRDLCEDNIDGVKVHYKVNSVKQIMPDGREVVWPESPQLYWDDSDYESWNNRLGPGKWYHSEGPYSEYMNRYECVFFYVDNLYRGKVTFEIEYEMYNAVLRYGDCSDLYIAMYSGDTTKYLESFSAEILIPNKNMPSAGNYKVTAYGTKAESFQVEESVTKNPGYYTFYFDLKEDELKFKPYNEYIEFDLVSYGKDKHIFAEYASRNDYYNDAVLDEVWEEQAYYETARERAQSTKAIVCIICVLVAAIIVLLGRKKIADLKRQYPFYTFEQTLDTYRDIPSDLDPNFAAELVFCKDKKREDASGVYSAILLSLSRKEYVELDEVSCSDVIITVNEKHSQNFNASPEFTPVDTTLEFEGYPTLNVAPIIDETPAIGNPKKFKGDAYLNILVESNQDPVAVESQYPLRTFFTTEPIGASKKYGSFGKNNTFATTEQLEVNTTFEVGGPRDTREPLTVCEQYYLDLIKRHVIGNSISMNELQSRISTDYLSARSFVDNIKRSVINIGISSGYFQKADWLEPKKKLSSSATKSFTFGVIFILANLISCRTRLDLAFGGLLLLGAAFMANGIYLKSHAHKYVLLTECGEEEYQKWRGLYNFLKSDTLIKERTVVELPLWEKYLVYATAFGISEKVISAIKIRCPEIQTETERKSIVHNPYCRSGRIRTSGSRFHSSVRSGYHGGLHSSGGFGYGGGGRGGGGGGGGH